MKTKFLTFLMTLAFSMNMAWAAGFDFNATIASGVTCSVHVAVLENPNAPNGKDVLLGPGLLHNANIYRKAVASIFSSPLYCTTVRRVLLLDPPGHGESGLPTGTQFGRLDLTNLATVVHQATLECISRGMGPETVVFHSMGGLELQILASQTPFSTLGVQKVRLDGSSQSREIPDPVLNSGFGLGLLSKYTYYNAVLGTNAQINPYLFVGFFFTDQNQQLLPGAPLPGQVMAEELKSNESYAAAFQALNVDSERPSVPAGVFSDVDLRVIIGAQDPFSYEYFQTLMWQHLSGLTGNAGVFVVPGAHDHFYSHPEEAIVAWDL